MKSLMILAALSMSTAALAQADAPPASHPPFCSKTVTDNCMQRSDARHATRHHAAKRKVRHHAHRKAVHHKMAPAKAPAAPLKP